LAAIADRLGGAPWRPWAALGRCGMGPPATRAAWRASRASTIHRSETPWAPLTGRIFCCN